MFGTWTYESGRWIPDIRQTAPAPERRHACRGPELEAAGTVPRSKRKYRKKVSRGVCVPVYVAALRICLQQPEDSVFCRIATHVFHMIARAVTDRKGATFACTAPQVSSADRGSVRPLHRLHSMFWCCLMVHP